LRGPVVTDAARDVKVMESEEDGSFAGHCPGIIGPCCCHGDDEVEVYRELCQIVEE
jgi:hypothetical protein